MNANLGGFGLVFDAHIAIAAGWHRVVVVAQSGVVIVEVVAVADGLAGGGRRRRFLHVGVEALARLFVGVVDRQGRPRQQ